MSRVPVPLAVLGCPLDAVLGGPLDAVLVGLLAGPDGTAAPSGSVGLGLAVTLGVLGASSPWWLSGRAVRRRACWVTGRRGRGRGGLLGPVGGGEPAGRWATSGGAVRQDDTSRGSRAARGTARFGRRRVRPQEPVEIGVLLELLAAAVRAGASVPRALDAVGTAVGGQDGEALRRAGASVVLGASWEAAWAGAPARLEVVRRALAPAWTHGAAPGAALRSAGEQLRHDRTASARQAAARLAVHLVLPLGVCYLPAFVLVGLVPVLLSLGVGLLGG